MTEQGFDKHDAGKTQLSGIADRIKAHRETKMEAHELGFYVWLYKHESIDVEAALRSVQSATPLSEHAAAVHANDCPKFRAFFMKYALGSKLPPSCLVCGQADADDIAIRHMELPNIIVCMTCRNAAQSAVRQPVEEEPHFWLNGYRREWRRYSHFQGLRVSYEDVVEWSGIDSDRERIRERVYTVTYAPPTHSEGKSGTLCPGDFVAFESGMVFNVTRTDKA